MPAPRFRVQPWLRQLPVRSLLNANPPTAATTASPGDKEKEKVTYKITAKDLNQMEEQTAAKASRPLQKHWANMTFYVMASLSIILPLLFLRKFS